MMERRIFDWRFILALAVLMLFAVASWGFVQRQHQVDGLIAVSQRTTAQVERQSAQIDDLSAQLEALKVQAALDAAASAKAARAAAREREQNRAILDYLREHGIDIPQSLAPRSGGGSGPKAPGPRGPQPAPSPPPASPGPPPGTPSPSPGVLDLVCELVPLICPLI